MIDGPILIVKLADIGDAVLALPAVQALRERYPRNRIDVLTTPTGAHVFRMSPAVDQIHTLAKQRFDHVRGLVTPGGMLELLRLTLELRRSGYGAVVILHHLTTAFGTRKFRALVRATGARVVAGLDNGRGGFLTHSAIDFGFGAKTEWEYGLEVVKTLGAKNEPRRPYLEIPASARRSARLLLQERSVDAAYAVIHTEVGEFSAARNWPRERFMAVARELAASERIQAVLVGTGMANETTDPPGDRHSTIDLAGWTTLEELCALVEGADLVIGCDSAVTHLAGAFDRPVIALFGPTNVRAWRPYSSREWVPGSEFEPDSTSLALHLDLPCSPCIYVGFRLGRPSGCPLRTCMMEIDSGDVTRSARVALQQNRQRVHENSNGENP